MKSNLLLALSLVLGACSSEGTGTAGQYNAAAPAASGFAEDLEDDPCAVLTADIVSEATGVPAGQLRQIDVSGLCRYTSDGITAEARFTVLPTAEEARERFERTYRRLPPEERARGQAALDDALDRRQQMRELGEREAATARGLGGTIADIAEATDYEPVEGIGDQAAYDGSVHVVQTGAAGAMTTAESRLHFRSENLIATVAAGLFDPGRDLEARRAGPPPEVRQRNREATLALGRAVLANLPAEAATR